MFPAPPLELMTGADSISYSDLATGKEQHFSSTGAVGSLTSANSYQSVSTRSQHLQPSCETPLTVPC